MPFLDESVGVNRKENRYKTTRLPTEKEKQKLSDRMKKLKRALALPPESEIPEIEEVKYSYVTDDQPLGTYNPLVNKITLNADLEGTPDMNDILAHELQHSYDYFHSPDKSDLMYYSTSYDRVTPKNLSKKIRNKAIQNLERQENKLVDKSLPVQPVPVREMYENIEKSKPKTNKPYWWED